MVVVVVVYRYIHAHTQIKSIIYQYYLNKKYLKIIRDPLEKALGQIFFSNTLNLGFLEDCYLFYFDEFLNNLLKINYTE